MRFVRVEEKKGGKVFDGVIISQSKKEIELIGCGPDESSLLRRHTFIKAKILISERCRENIKAWFETALAHSEKKVVDAEFEVLFAKKELERRRLLYKEVFK